MPEGEGSAAGGTGASGGAAGGTGGQGTGVNPDDVGQGGTGGGGTDDSGGQGSGTGDQNGQIKALRDEAAKTRAELRRAQEALKKYEQEKMTDSEKQAARLKELEDQNNALLRRARDADVQAAAIKAGATAPEVVAKLVDPEAENLAAAVEKIKKEYPMLFGKQARGSADGGNAPPPAPKHDMNAMIRAAAGYKD